MKPHLVQPEKPTLLAQARSQAVSEALVAIHLAQEAAARLRASWADGGASLLPPAFEAAARLADQIDRETARMALALKSPHGRVR
jgi:hypothetical protein